MKQYFIILITLFIVNYAAAQECNIYEEIKNYEKELVQEAIYSIFIDSVFLSDLKGKDYSLYKGWEAVDKTELEACFCSYYIQLDKLQKGIIVRRINKWCFSAIFLLSLSDSNINITEILYKCHFTNHLFEEYIINPGQYWASLSIDQESNLFYNATNYMSQLSNKNYFEVYKSLLSNVDFNQIK